MQDTQAGCKEAPKGAVKACAGAVDQASLFYPPSMQGYVLECVTKFVDRNVEKSRGTYACVKPLMD